MFGSQKAAVRRGKAGMHDGELKKAARAKDAMNFLKRTGVIGNVHETHDSRCKIERSGGEGQLHGIGDRITDGMRLRALLLGGELDEGGCDIYREHLRAALCEQSRVMAFAAADVQPALPGHVGKQIEKGGRIDGVTINIPALAGQASPSERVRFPVSCGLAMVHETIVAGGSSACGVFSLRRRRHTARLAPVTALIVIAAVRVDRAARHPDRMWTGRAPPISGNPDVSSAPIPEAFNPHIAGARRVADSPNDHRSRRRWCDIIRAARGTTHRAENCQCRH